MQVRVYRAIDGAPVGGSNIVPFSKASYKLAENEPGSMDLALPRSSVLAAWNARRKLRPWWAVAALIDDGEVVHAGPVLRRKWTPKGGLQVSVGGGWDLLSKRLVLNHALDAAWIDGEVLLDEDNPSPEWVLRFAGLSLGGIGAGLVQEALKWGGLCIDSPETEPGTAVRTYRGWDFATTADRITELTQVEGGPLVRFRPYLREDGYLRFAYEAGVPGSRRHRLSTAMQGHGVTVEDVDEDGDTLATEAYALGGREEDIVLAARRRSTTLTSQGYPVMMVGTKSHSSVSELTTLQGHVGQAVIDGSTIPESTQLKMRRSRGVLPGDVVDLTMRSSFHGTVDESIRVAQISGDATSEWVTVNGFPEGA